MWSVDPDQPGGSWAQGGGEALAEGTEVGVAPQVAYLGRAGQAELLPGDAGYDITPTGTANSGIATGIELTVGLQPGAGVGTGTGLKAQYWTNTTFSGTPALTRTDASLNFAWRTKGSPATSIPVDNFSARWTGNVQAQFTGPHTFVVVSDETVKVWINGQLVIDHSTPHTAAVDSATVNLVAGTKYTIRVDYTEHTGEAYLKLLWFNPNRRQRIIPTSQLYPAA